MKNYEVYFGRMPITNMKLMKTFETKEQAENFICKSVKENHEPNYYIRIWEEDGVKWYDYGSWSEFYAIKPLSKNS